MIDIQEIAVLPSPEVSEKQRAEWEKHRVDPDIKFSCLIFLIPMAYLLLLTYLEPNITYLDPRNPFTVLNIVAFALCLTNAILAIRQHYRLARIPAAEKARRQEFEALADRIARFNVRLTALQEIAVSVTKKERPGLDVVAKYATEREELSMLLRPYASTMRTEKLLKLERAIADNDEPRYRATRDVSDHVYVHGLRFPDETGELPEDDELLEEDATAPTSAQQRRA